MENGQAHYRAMTFFRIDSHHVCQMYTCSSSLLTRMLGDCPVNKLEQQPRHAFSLSGVILMWRLATSFHLGNQVKERPAIVHGSAMWTLAAKGASPSKPSALLSQCRHGLINIGAPALRTGVVAWPNPLTENRAQVWWMVEMTTSLVKRILNWR